MVNPDARDVLESGTAPAAIRGLLTRPGYSSSWLHCLISAVVLSTASSSNAARAADAAPVASTGASHDTPAHSEELSAIGAGHDATSPVRRR
jgi:hypothetical protein